MSNHLTPPDAQSDSAALMPHLAKYFSIMVGAQFVATMVASPWYFELVKTGATSFLAFLVAIASSVCLYQATYRVLRNGHRASVQFPVAAIGLAYAAWHWHLPHVPALISAYGALLAVGGWRLPGESHAA